MDGCISEQSSVLRLHGGTSWNMWIIRCQRRHKHPMNNGRRHVAALSMSCDNAMRLTSPQGRDPQCQSDYELRVGLPLASRGRLGCWEFVGYGLNRIGKDVLELSFGFFMTLDISGCGGNSGDRYFTI